MTDMRPLLQPAPYDTLRETFRWNIAPHLNMAAQVCDDWAARDPDRVAIVTPSGDGLQHITYGTLRDMADALAGALHARGITRGDRIGVLRAQGAWCAAAHIAIWKIGAISIPLFQLFKQDALRSRLEDAGARLVVTDTDCLDILPELPNLATLVPEQENLPEGRFETAETSADDPAVLIYTSGTTGSPKGALHAHRVLTGHLPGVEMSHDFLGQPNDRLWTPADWAWIGGLFDVLMPGLAIGVPVVAARMTKFSPEACVNVIRDAAVRNVFFPPTALRMLKASDARIEGLRSVASGGEPLGAEMLDWGQRAIGVTINEFYGQTECNMVGSSCAALFDPVPGCVGRAVPGHEVAVIDAEGRKTDLEGDIAVKRESGSMMLGYWNKPAETTDKFRGDWMVTGDRGVIEGGFIRFVGREDDVITSAGYRIGPSEIEDCLLTHDGVATAAVVGKPDVLRTQIVKAYVVLKPGVTVAAEELQSWVKERLASYAYPREIEFIDALPMTVTGKVIRKELKARAAAEVNR